MSGHPDPVVVGAVASGLPDATAPLKPYVEGRALMDSLEAVQRFLRAAIRRTEAGEGGLAELALMAEIRRMAEQVVDTSARHLLAHDDASYREIGVALGITRQSANERYPQASSRPAGGQRSALL